MASIDMLLEPVDVPLLLGWLNDQVDTAWIVPVPERFSADSPAWRAVERLSSLPDGRHCIWHVPGPPLSIPRRDHRLRDKVIADPWAGWTEERPGADPWRPYFGAGHLSVIWLNLHTDTAGHAAIYYDSNGMRCLDWHKDPSHVHRSTFEWIGRHYAVLGEIPAESTERFWRRLQRFIRKIGVRVPVYEDATKPRDWHAYAFPSAAAEIAAGKPRKM